MKWAYEFCENYLKGRKIEAFKIRNEHFPENMKLYKYQNISDKKIDSLLNGEIYLSKRSALNDPFELDPVYYDSDIIENLGITNDEFKIILEGLYENMGVMSLSSRYDNMPLWTHYGDEHKGICVEYDINSVDKEIDNEFYYRIYKAIYTDSRIDLTKLVKDMKEAITNGGDMSLIMNVLLISMLIKQKDWLYEDEWRILWELDECNNCLYKSPMRVSAIYIGKDCTEDNIKLIKDVAKAIKCDLYKMVYPKETDEYRLTYIKLNI